MFGNRGWVANEHKSDRIECLPKKRLLPHEQQLSKRVNGRRIRVAQTSRLEAVELTDIHATAFWRSRHVVEKMTAVGQETRKAGTILLWRLQSRHRDDFAARCGNTENRTTRGSREENNAITTPRAAAHARCTREDLDRSAVDVDALQPVLSQKSD